MDAPELKRDLARADADCIAFEADYKGRLDALASEPAKLAEALKRYEAIEDLLGRIISYASLVYAGNTHRSRSHEILRRRAGAVSPRRRCIFCSSRWS